MFRIRSDIRFCKIFKPLLFLHFKEFNNLVQDQRGASSKGRKNNLVQAQRGASSMGRKNNLVQAQRGARTIWCKLKRVQVQWGAKSKGPKMVQDTQGAGSTDLRSIWC